VKRIANQSKNALVIASRPSAPVLQRARAEAEKGPRHQDRVRE
jgi:hypothetical protein